MWKIFVSEYLSFTRKERIGIFCLLSLILACILFPLFFHFIIHEKAADEPGFEKEIASLKMLPADTAEAGEKMESNAYHPREYSSHNYHPDIHPEIFYFDPNTATASDW